MNIQIELTNRCNLTCVECPHRFMQRERQDMSFQTVQAVIDKCIIPYKPGTLILHKDGEPLLHPDFEEIVKRFTEISDAKVDIYTNGTRLTKDKIEFMKDLTNKFWFLVSFHLFNADGKRNDYVQIAENLVNCLAMRTENFEFVIATHKTDFADMDELDAWKARWIEIAKIYPALRGIHINTALNPWLGLIDQGNTITFPACPYADGQHLFIGVTGNVLACCMDLEEDLVFGNVHDQDFNIAMTSRQRHYQNLRSGKILEDVCKRCLTKP